MATEASGFPRFSFGSTVSDIFGVIGRNFLLLCGLALLLYGVPSALFTIYLMNSVMSLASGSAFSGSGNPLDIFSMLGTGFVLGIIGSIFISIYTQGAMIWSVLHDLDGGKPTFGGALSAGLRFFLPILAITIIFYVAIAAIAAIPALLVFGIGVISIAVLLFLFIIIPLLVFATVLLMWAVPAAINERIGPIEALSRSIYLSSGNRWKLVAMLVIYLLTAVVVSSAISGVAMPFTMAGDLDPASPFDGLMPIMAIQSLLNSLILVLGYPAIAATYHNLRISKEGASPEGVADIFE